ncbi:17112_t:CDS:2 [Racocetra fulgida]|uniref:17112_t:CDS:1 n=1 Tax=Racocetra fulgida TaxID=60492 RepID=A0A9N9G3L4_9GLOM|nr:17112_t:CDS:2 [Racocetra fulgida]
MAPKKITKKINTKIYSITKAEFLSGQNIENMTHLSSNTPEIYSTNDKVLNTNEIFKYPKANEDFNWKQSFNMSPVLTVFPESCSDNDDNNTTTTNSYPVTPTTLAASPVSFTLVQHYEDVNNFKHENHENSRPITPPLEKEQATKTSNPSKRRSKRTREEYLAKFKLPINGIATRTRNRTQNTAADRTDLAEQTRRKPMNTTTGVVKSKNPNYPIPISKEEVRKKWSTDNQKIFLATYLCNGKDFAGIAQKTGKKSTEVVEYYYMFKHNKDFRAAKEMMRENQAYEEYLGSIEAEMKAMEKMAQSYAPKFSGKKKGVPGRPKRSNGKSKSKK